VGGGLHNEGSKKGSFYTLEKYRILEWGGDFIIEKMTQIVKRAWRKRICRPEVKKVVYILFINGLFTDCFLT